LKQNLTEVSVLQGTTRYSTNLLIDYTYLLGFFLELLNSPLVDASAFVDQVTGSGRLARVDMADDDDVDMDFLCTHFHYAHRNLQSLNNTHTHTHTFHK